MTHPATTLRPSTSSIYQTPPSSLDVPRDSTAPLVRPVPSSTPLGGLGGYGPQNDSNVEKGIMSRANSFSQDLTDQLKVWRLIGWLMTIWIPFVSVDHSYFLNNYTK